MTDWSEYIESVRKRSRELMARHTDTCPFCGKCDLEGWAECIHQFRDDELCADRCRIGTVV